MTGREKQFPIFREIFKRKYTSPKRLSETAPFKETNPGSIITQVSFGIACIEEGPHIARAITQLTARQEIPKGTDVLIAISDNGSRGAWKLIEQASTLQKQEQQLYDSVPTNIADDFVHLTTDQKELQHLRYTAMQSLIDTTQQTAIQQQIAEITKKLNDQLPYDQTQQLTQFLDHQQQYQQDLLLALTNPEAFIRQTDAIRPPLILSQEPTFWQQETIREYAAILSGKYNSLPQNIRIQLASGSEMGNFGSVKEVARKVAVADYQQHHSDASPKSHVIFIGDMDTNFAEKRLIKGLVESFSKHPDAPAVQARVGAAWDRKHKPGELTPLPIHRETSNVFGDITNFGAFFQEEGRQPKHIIPTSKDISGFFGLPHLLIGPALIFRGDMLSIDTLADQGEDLKFSADLHQRFPRIQLPYHRDIAIGFNIRGAQNNPFRLLTDFHAAITPYKHQEWERLLGHDAHMQFRQEIFGYGHRLPLAGEIIRQIEEKRYQLQSNEYVDSYLASKSGRFRRKLFNDKMSDQRITDTVWDNKTQYYFQARIKKLPPTVALQPNEYVARELSQKEFATKQKKLYRGERIISVDSKQFLIRTHLQKDDAPKREIFIATA